MFLKIAALIVFACICVGATIIGVLAFASKDDSPATVSPSAPTTAVPSSPQTVVVVTRECTDEERQREQNEIRAWLVFGGADENTRPQTVCS